MCAYMMWKTLISILNLVAKCKNTSQKFQRHCFINIISRITDSVDKV